MEQVSRSRIGAVANGEWIEHAGMPAVGCGWVDTLYLSCCFKLADDKTKTLTKNTYSYGGRPGSLRLACISKSLHCFSSRSNWSVFATTSLCRKRQARAGCKSMVECSVGATIVSLSNYNGG